MRARPPGDARWLRAPVSPCRPSRPPAPLRSSPPPEPARAAQAAQRQAQGAQAGRGLHRPNPAEDPVGVQRRGLPRARGLVQRQALRFPKKGQISLSRPCTGPAATEQRGQPLPTAEDAAGPREAPEPRPPADHREPQGPRHLTGTSRRTAVPARAHRDPRRDPRLDPAAQAEPCLFPPLAPQRHAPVRRTRARLANTPREAPTPRPFWKTRPLWRTAPIGRTRPHRADKPPAQVSPSAPSPL